MRRRIFSTLLALVMVFSLLPATAFAVNGDALDTVSPVGTTIDLFDYWVTSQTEGNTSISGKENSGINNGHSLKFRSDDVSTGSNSINTWTGNNGGINTGIVQPLLQNGYPVLANSRSTGINNGSTSGDEGLAYLFDGNNISGAKQAYTGVGGLLTVNEDGYFYFNSAEMSASYQSNSFVVRQNNSSIGFFPFNNINANGQYVNSNNDVITTPQGGSIPADSGDLNHFFGVHMSTQFIQSENGKTEKDEDVTYKFTGDDDVWIFVDGVLVGDVGGIHNKSTVEINFATGAVTYETYNNAGNVNSSASGIDSSTILDQYLKAAQSLTSGAVSTSSNGTDWNSGTLTGATSSSFSNDNWVKVTINGSETIFKKVTNSDSTTGWIYADDTYHTLDFFYLERGASASNMLLQYNLEEIPPSYVKKVDQDGRAVGSVPFELKVAAYNGADEVTVVTGSTNDKGELELRYSAAMNSKAGHLLSLKDVYQTYSSRIRQTEDGEDYIEMTLSETEPPEGYRTVGDISLRLQEVGNGNYVLLSNNIWDKGAYAMSTVTATTQDAIKGAVETSKSATLSDENNQGLMFAVVLSKGTNFSTT